MAKKWYHNIFNYYTRLSRSEESEDRKEDVLEDNVTKALINVLELSDSESKVRQRFVRWLSAQGGVRLSPGITDYFLQTTKPPNHAEITKSGRTKFILGIVPRGWKNCAEEGWQRKKTTIPDAWLVGKNWTAIIESKCRKGLDKAQIEGHRKHLRCRKRIAIQVDWKDMHNLFDELAKTGTVTPKDRFLLVQFCEFLRLNGLAGFPGFTHEDFKFLCMGESAKRDNLSLRGELIGKLWALAEDLWESDNIKEMYPWYSDPSTSLLYKPRESASFFFVDQEIPKEEQRRLEKLSNSASYRKKERELLDKIKESRFFVEVLLDGAYSGYVEVYAGAQASALQSLASLSEAQWRRLWEIVRKIRVPFSIQVLDANSESLLWKRKGEITKEEIVEDEAWLDRVRKSVQKACMVSGSLFAVTRCWNKQRVMDLGKGLAAEIVNAMKEFHRVVKFINDETDSQK